MNCDDVFAILTRGPFPTGEAHDEAVELHLSLCPSCNQLAAALRPNSPALEELAAASSEEQLPYYRGNAGTPVDWALPPHLATLRCGGEKSKANALAARIGGDRGLRLWQFAAAISLGMVLAAALRTLVVAHQQPGRLADAGDATPPALVLTENHASAPQRQTLLASLPPVCRGEQPAREIVPVGFENPESLKELHATHERCCRQCHLNGEPVRLRNYEVALTTIHRACQTCHSWAEGQR